MCKRNLYIYKSFTKRTPLDPLYKSIELVKICLKILGKSDDTLQI